MRDFSEHLDLMFSEYKKHNVPICVNFRDIVHINNFDRLTHYIHSYPAKLLQCIPVYFINNSLLSSYNDIIYDPFCGSGTVAVETLNYNRCSINRDINPLASMLTRVKCTHIDEEEINNFFQDTCRKILKYKAKDHNITNQNFWYKKDVYNMLSKIFQYTSDISDERISNLFKICFSTTARKTSFADPRISVPVKLNPEKYPNGHRLRIAAEKKISELNPQNTLGTFKSQVIANAKRIGSISHLATNKLHIETCRAQCPPAPEFEGQVSLIVTSPPYPGAQKYIRASSLSLRWLELHTGCLTPLKKQVIGREEVSRSEYTGHSTCPNADKQIWQIAQKDIERAAVAESYLREMRDVFKSCWRHLKTGGYMVVVAANNLFCGIEFYTQQYLSEIAVEESFSLELELIDDIKSYGLMTKRNKTASVISREIVSVFRKH